MSGWKDLCFLGEPSATTVEALDPAMKVVVMVIVVVVVMVLVGMLMGMNDSGDGSDTRWKR